MDKAKFEKLVHDIKDTKGRIDSLRTHIQTLDEQVALHKSLEKQFSQNLAVLRDDAIIAMASEFKKIKEDLSVVVTRLKNCQLDVKNSKVFLERAEKLLIDLEEKHAIMLEERDGKIIIGRFRNNGKKRDP